MKKLFLLMTLLFATSASAYKVDLVDVVCGEIDPFIIGDACIVKIRDYNDEKVALVIDFDDFLDKFDENSKIFNGRKTIDVEFDFTFKISSSAVIKALKDYDDEYFYLRAYPESIEL